MWMHVEWILFYNPVTTGCKLYVCGEISWWTGQALILGQSYTRFPQMNTDTAQQFSTSWGCGSVADINRSSWASSSGVWRSWNERNRALFSHSYCNTCECQGLLTVIRFLSSSKDLIFMWLSSSHYIVLGLNASLVGTETPEPGM